jgi:dihydrofolate synthase/folylpolyglutamate synthase
LERLYARTNAGIKPGIDAIAVLLKELGDPQDKFLCIHVAGTNGKGSVSAMLDAIFRAAGLKTGLYTSPHLVHFNERFKFQGNPISDAFLEELINKIDAADVAVANQVRPCTFFELSTAIAFTAFAELQVQVAIIETGLGGRWDATNVIHPLVSVITPISVDHTEFLGASLIGIAGEKAGIIKPGRPVVVAEQIPEVLDVLRAEAEHVEAPFVEQEHAVSISRVRQSLDGQALRIEGRQQDYGTCKLPLLGEHQIQNVGLAVVAAECAFQELGLELEAEAVKKGLAEVSWPGRCQVLQHQDPPMLIDGAHNPAGAAMLDKSLKDLFPGKQGAFVFGFLGDKDPQGMIRAVRDRVGQAFATASASPRSVHPDKVKNELMSCKLEAEAGTLHEMLEHAMQWARAHDTYVCVTGSLYLMGEMLEWQEMRTEKKESSTT